jgi:hypothetical protein
LPAVRNRLGQIERTVIGHLHSPGLLRLARLLPRKPGGWKPTLPGGPHHRPGAGGR